MPCRKLLLRLLAEHASKPTDKAALLFLCSRSGRDAYASQIRQPHLTLLDILEEYPSISFATPEPLLDLLPALAPRLYSISNSPVKGQEEVHFAFSVVRHTHGKRTVGLNGVATGDQILLHRCCT